MTNETIIEQVISEMKIEFPTLSETEILVAQVAIRRYAIKMS
jgi:hypothetical protein